MRSNETAWNISCICVSCICNIHASNVCVCVRVCLFFVVLLALQTSAISTWVYLSDVSSDASQRATCIFFILFSSKNDDFLSKSGPFFDAAGGSSEARALPATSWPPHLVPAWNGSFLIAADCQYHFIVWIGWIHALDLWHKGFHFFGKFRVNLWPETEVNSANEFKWIQRAYKEGLGLFGFFFKAGLAVLPEHLRSWEGHTSWCPPLKNVRAW